MDYLAPKKLLRALGIGLIFGFSYAAQAVCNNPKNWFETPGPENKIFIGYKQDQQGNFGNFNVSQTSVDFPYPEPLPKEMVGREGSGNLPTDQNADVSYYEPDGKGNWRVCRTEIWWSRPEGDQEVRKMLKPITERYVENNPVLKKIASRNVAMFAKMFFYDAKGRVIRLEEGDFRKPDQKASIKICRQYDDDDNLTLLLDPRNSQSCRATPLDVRDEWLQSRYAKYDGKTVELLNEWHRGSASGKWSKSFDVFRSSAGPDAVFGAAKAKEGKGVTIIYGSNAGRLDNNAANTVLDTFGKVGAVAYWFIKPPVPLEVLEKPELIYQYERRRQTYIDGGEVKLLELFQPNGHRSRHRYYVMGGYVVRHEQFEANGRVTRVITLNDWRQPRPGGKPDINDKLLTDEGLSISAHQIYHRVYDFDAEGKPKLVAVSWNRAIRNPLKNTSVLSADVVYGTPSGKERWRNKQEFAKYFDFSPEADQVYPDLANGEEPEKI